MTNTITVTTPGLNAGVNSAYSLQMNGSDSAAGQTLTFTATGLPSGLSISSSGLISGTPTATGVSSVTVTATDTTEATGSTTFDLVVTNNKMSSLVDNFASNDLSSLWSHSFGTVTYSSGQVAIKTDTSYDSALVSSRAYDLTSSSLYFKMSPYVATDSETEVRLQTVVDSNNDMLMVGQSGNNWHIIYTNSVGTQTNLWSMTYNSTSMAWMRIREAGGTTFFDTAPDGLTWTNQFSCSDTDFPFSLTSLYVSWNPGDFGSDPTGTTYIYAVNSPVINTSFIDANNPNPAVWGSSPVFEDDFNTLCSKGNFLTTYTDWTAYPTNYHDTDNSGYYNPGNISVIATTDEAGNNIQVMDVECIPGPSGTSGESQCGAPYPNVNGIGTGVSGMRVEMRVRVVNGGTGWVIANLIWPESGNWPHDGEIDFFNQNANQDIIQIFNHRYGGTSGGDQDTASITASQAVFHVVCVEWLPGESITWYVDGTQYAQFTDAIEPSSDPMRLVLQIESNSGSGNPPAGMDVQYDWIRVHFPVS